MSINIQNPFITGNKLFLPGDARVEINYSNVSKHFRQVFVLVKKSNEKLPIDFFKRSINEDTFNMMKENLVIWKTSVSILKNKNNIEKLVIVNQEKLKDFNQFSFDLQENNLVLPILNISFKNIINYLKNMEGISNLEEIYNYLVISHYLKDELQLISAKNKSHFESLIKNLEEANYWTFTYNCSTNLTKPFNKRRFNNIFRKLLKDKQNISTKNEKNNENYLEFVMKSKRYVDASSISNFKNYYISNNDKFTKKDILNLFCCLDKKQQYFLLCNLMVSKDYSRLVFNSHTLSDMGPVIKRNGHLFRYLMGYAWLNFYFEESIKKSKLKTTDNCVFDIDTVGRLPVFPFSHNFPKLNPYMPIMVSDKVLNSDKNINGVINYKINDSNTDFYTKGICPSLQYFRTRLNLFSTGYGDVDLFSGVEWEKHKIAIGGSVMSACLQVLHPLANMFKEKEDYLKILRFFAEYYSLADIDVMFLTNNVFEFIDRVAEFYNQIVVNVCSYTNAEPEHIKLSPSFHIHFFVKDSWIKENLVNENITFDFIFKNIEEASIKEMFKPFLKEELNKMVNETFKDKTEEEINEIKKKYPCYFQPYEEYCINIKIINNLKNSFNKKEEINKNNDLNDLNDETTIQKPSVYNKDIEVKVNYKFTIKSPHLNHSLELFMSKGEDHMNLVSQFHLPCVRAFYTGSNVYMTPSCIFAHMTYMNIDYKYFSGSKDPIEIINKNRMRGFGTWLNENEIENLVKYSSQVDFWSNIYGDNDLNSTDAPPGIIKNTVCGAKPFNNKLFHPRIVNPDYFYEVTPVELGEINFNSLKGNEIVTKTSALEEINKVFNITGEPSFMTNLQVINEEGYINPLQKWVIDAFWEMYESKVY